MLLNDDFSARTLVHAAALEWVPSPAKGVDRRMLFRLGEEKARATSIVRYAPGSRFAYHEHPGGEEFLVLDGVFRDETGDFPAGTYVRNPPGTGHAPASDPGCTILVKLWQFRIGDRTRVVCLPGQGEAFLPRPGVTSSRLLFEDAGECVVIEEWQADTVVELSNSEGLELLVIAGGFTEAGDQFDRWTWLRLPAGQSLRAKTGPAGARIWYKAAPLQHNDVCAFEPAAPQDAKG